MDGIRVRTIAFTPDRAPTQRRIRLGYEGDNLVERLEFDLPEITTGQTATLMIAGADAVKLDRTDEGRYAVDLTRDMIGPDGEREAYVRIDGAGGEVWQSAVLRMITGALPDVEEEIERVYPTAVGQMLTAMAEHSSEMNAQEERVEQAAQRAEEAAERAEAGGGGGGGGTGGGGAVEIDATLTQEGKAADAKATGDRLSELSKEMVFDTAKWGLPVLALTGDISAMTKENAVDLAYEYEGRSGTASVKWQGSSSLSYPKKNFTVKFDNAFEAATGWGAQKKYCTKANFIDHSHARNIVSAKLWGQIVKAKPTDGFDMAACKGMINAGDNSIVPGTEPIDGVITISQHLSNHGFRYIDGYVCKKDFVYALEADVFVTSAEATKSVVLGVGVSTSDGIYFSEKVETNKWCRVSAQFANPYENGLLALMLESATSTEKLQFKNVTVKHSIGKNEFDAANASLVNTTGGDMSFAGSVNGGNVVVNRSLYNQAVCIGGTTYPKGKYTIVFSAATSKLESEVGYEISVGFAKDTARNAITVKLEAQYAIRRFVLEVENELDDAYLTIQPIGGADKENVNMRFSFNGITVYSGSLVEGTSSQITASPNGGAIDGFPIIITINGAFQGLYTFNIPKDGWMMGMGGGDQEAILCADYSEACWFRADATLNGDFDLEYVSDEDNADWVVPSINRLINACKNSDGTDLDTTVAQYLDWGSAIDYFIFKKLLNGVDMGGKNYLLATYDGVKWFFSAYDMDCVYGLDWDGKRFYAAKNGANAEPGGHTVDVLIVTYKKEELKQRYAELRAGILSDDNFATTVANFIGGIPKAVYMEDAKRWPTIPNTATNDMHQIVDYYCRRAAILDEAFSAL